MLEHVPRHKPRQVLKHVLRHMPTRHVPGHIPQNRQPDPPSLDIVSVVTCREREQEERTSGSYTDSYEENMEVIPYHRSATVKTVSPSPPG